MSTWISTKAGRVYAALVGLGWTLEEQVGSRRKLQRPGWRNLTFCFHDDEEVGPTALAKTAKDTGVRPEDLRAHQMFRDRPRVRQSQSHAALRDRRAFLVPDLAESLGTTWIIGRSALSEDHNGGMDVMRPSATRK